MILSVELVDGKLVWEHRGQVLDDKLLVDRLGIQWAIDDTVGVLMAAKFDFLTALQALQALKSWCDRHGVGTEPGGRGESG